MRFINYKVMNGKLSGYIFFIMILLIALPGLSAQLDLSVIDDKGNPLKDAVAAIVPVQNADYTALPPAIMDQRQNMFVPGVLAIRVNTQVRFPNSDDIRHHVYSFSPAKKFELRLYHGMTAEPVLFDKPGTVVLGCNIHDSMVAYIYVVETDYFAVTDMQGKVSLKAPAGKYQLQIYHPQMNGGYPESAVTLNESQIENRTVTLDNLSAVTKTEPADEFSNLF
jgi:plastocyanin